MPTIFALIEKLIRAEATLMLADRFDQPGFSPVNRREDGCQRTMLAQLIATVSLVVSIAVVTIAFIGVARAGAL